MTDFLDSKRSEIIARLNELRPAVEEYHELEAAAAALDGLPATTATVTRANAAPTRTVATTRGRPKGSGTRAAECVAIVRANPGITIPEIAAKIGIKQNYLYRVLPGLADDGLVRKDGRGWRPNT